MGARQADPRAASARRPSRRDRKSRGRVRGEVRALEPLLLFFFLLLIKTWGVRWMALGNANPLLAVALEGGAILLVLALAGVLAPVRHRMWAYLLIDAVFSALLFASAVYVAQFEQVPTTDALAQAGQLSTVMESVWALIKPAYLLLFADIVVLTVVLTRTASRRHGIRPEFDRRLALAGGVGIAWTAVVVVSLLAAGPIADSVAGASGKGLLAYEFAGAAIASAAEGADSPAAPGEEPVDFSKPASVQHAIDTILGPSGVRVEGAPATGSAAGKNVLLIQAEALQSFVVGLEVNGREVTPNLNDLVAESWFAPVAVTQIGKGNTSDAEFVANTSLLTRKGTPASVSWETKAVPSLARLLSAQGYDTQTMHANTVTYWNRDQLYPMLGFDRYRDVEFFGDADKLGMGASDKTFFRKALPLLEDLAEKDTPFYAHLVQLSSHHPFGAVSARSDLEVPNSLDGTLLGKYLRAENYADIQLGAAIDRLKEDGLWEETVVVVYGDHFGLTLSELTDDELGFLKQATGREYTVAEHFRVPIVVHLPGQTEGGVLQGTYGQIDLMPTVADVLGLDLSQTVHFGRSIFEGGSPLQPVRYYAPEGTFFTDTLFFRPGIGYDDATVRLVDGAEAARDLVSEAEYQQAMRLIVLNEAYLTALPQRSGTSTTTAAE